MSVFNSFTGSCETAPTSNISDYYNIVGEYVKSTLTQYSNNDQHHQSTCVVTNNNKINLYSEHSFNGNLNTHCGYSNVSHCVQNYHIPESRQIVSKNTPVLYNTPYLNQNNCNANTMYRHFYHLKKSSLKVNMKKKRKRTMFTTEQIIALEAVFQKKPYINREERMIMMQKLQVSEKSVKIWFQNRRRLTDRKDKDYVSDSPSSDDSSEIINDRLTYIESEIQRNTDEYGYVTLDDKVMTELVHIIDDILSQDVSWNISPLNSGTTVLQNGNNENIVMYEPISPVSLSEALDDM